jgi:RNA polymerase primary sigma factor
MALPPGPEPGQRPSDAQKVRELAATAGGGRGLDAAERDRLLEAAGRGDQKARDRLTSAHLEWVVSAAAERAERGLSQGDLFQEGTIGLILAIEHYSRSGREDFEAFAREQVAGHMDRAIGDEEKAVADGRLLVQAAQDYVQAEVSLRQELGRSGTELELAQSLEWSVARTTEIGRIVADARRRHDEELLQYLEPGDIDLDTLIEDRRDGDGG